MTEHRPTWRKSSRSTEGTSEQCVEVARLPWRKSTHSDETGGHCVELALFPWRKSTRSDETGGQCVELAAFPHAIAIRDSKAPDAGHLTLTPRAFAVLLSRAKRDTLPR
ncbi:hypothetical protein GCM10010402_41670 [Actinomadura luteofluorescens]|nr:protein of unknown function (DUF397) [Actinomadura glauciflava]